MAQVRGKRPPLRSSSTVITGRDRGSARRRISPTPKAVGIGGRRLPRWRSLSWRASLLLFLGPLALLFGTLTYAAVRAPEIVLSVSDAYTGQPLVGSEVVGPGERTWATGDEGTVRLESVGGSREFTIRHAGYAPADLSVDGSEEGERAVALRPSTVEGRLTNADDGAPLVAAVSVLSNQGPIASAQTDADGYFSIPDVPADARLRIEAGDFGVIEEPIGQRTRVDRSLERTVVTGVVADAAGGPIAGASVVAADGTVVTTTDDTGQYRLLGGADLAEVVARAPGFADQRVALPENRQVSFALEPERMRAIYAPLGVMTDPERLQTLIDIANTTEINAIVVDVKQDTIFYETEVAFFQDIPGMVQPAIDPAQILAQLEENGIYAIARMVVFKDPVVAEGRPDLAVRDEVSGGVWRDFNGAAWVNAFNEELWNANAALAAELAGIGFDEIQYDYIRFPSDGDLTTADFGPDYSETARRAAITGAVGRGAEAVRGTGARFAIDLFPIIALQGNDQGIGQTLQDLVPLVDYVNLMIYPSHYEEGNVPVDGHPNDAPGETVAYTLQRAEELVPGSVAKMRPWLQDFDYPAEGFTAYGPDDVRAQIDAAEAAGATGWLLWNAAGKFEVAALNPEE